MKIERFDRIVGEGGGRSDLHSRRNHDRAPGDAHALAG